MARLVEAATAEFIAAQGFERTQMDAVAKRLGIAKGSLYLYVESKEALFDLCVRFAGEAGGAGLDAVPLPYRSESGADTMAYVQTRLGADGVWQAAAGILLAEDAPEPLRDLERLIRILYRALDRNRQAIKLVEAAARDHPRLSTVWYPNARGHLLDLLLPYIERHIGSGAFRAAASAPMAARHLIETCTFWAVHRHWDPAPQAIDEAQAEDAVVDLILPVFARQDA